MFVVFISNYLLFRTFAFMSSVDKDQHVVVVGAGVFGLSIALHLARAGYCNDLLFVHKLS